MMLIDIIVPREFRYHNILSKTKQYYKFHSSSNVFADDEKKYCLSVKKKNIRFTVFDFDETVQKEINEYIEFVFENGFIGIVDKYEIVNPSGVKVYKL